MSTRRIHRKRRKMHTAITTVFVAVFAFIAIVSSIVLRYEIIKADSEIITLQARVDEVKKTNDNLEGELLAKQDFTHIETVATEELGMVRSKEKNNKVISMQTAQQDVSEEEVEQNASEEGILNLFTWITQIIR